MKGLQGIVKDKVMTFTRTLTNFLDSSGHPQTTTTEHKVSPLQELLAFVKYKFGKERIPEISEMTPSNENSFLSAFSIKLSISAALTVIAVTIFCLFLIVITTKYVNQCLKMRKIESIPGPGDSALPILGNALDIKRCGGFSEFLTKNHKEFGPIIKFTLNGERMVSVNDSDILKQMKIFKMFRPDGGIDFLKGLIGVRSVGFLQGDKAKKRRAVLHKIFTGQNLDRLVKSFVPCIESYLDHWIKMRGQKSVSKETISVDIQNEIRPLWMALNTMNIFGEEVDTGEISKSFEEALKLCLSLRYQYFPLIPYVSNAWYEKRVALDKVHKNIDILIQSHMQKKYKGLYSNTENQELKHENKDNLSVPEIQSPSKASSSDLLSYLLEYLNEVESKVSKDFDFTYEDLHDEMTTFLFANFENFTIVSNAMYHISRDHDLQQQIRREIQEVFPSKIINHADSIDISKLQKLHKTRAAISEALRVSTFGTLFRLNTEELDVTDTSNSTLKFKIPESTSIVIPMFLVHTNPKFWGPNADVFDVKNFLNVKNIDDAPANSPYKFMPFGFGQRMCLGYRFAIEVSCLVVAMICEKFTSIHSMQEDIEWKEASFNVLAKDGIKLEMAF